MPTRGAGTSFRSVLAEFNNCRLPYNRQCLSYDDCLEGNREDYQGRV